MRTAVVELTLKDLRQAVLDYCEKHAIIQPDTAVVMSYDKPVIMLELYQGGCISAEEFSHKHGG